METTMAIKGLTFTTMPAIVANPAIDRRNRIIARLEEQKLLAKDPNYKRTVKLRETKGSPLVEKQQRVVSWVRPAANGTFALVIRAGKAVEFEKGKTAIVIPSLDKLPAVIDTLIDAVRSGELDEQLAAATKPVGKRTKKN
jgi:hypothetical protein